MHYHAIAVLSGDRRKSIVNKSEEQILTEIVIPYESRRIIRAQWGDKTQSYQVIELRIYRTNMPWDKKTGVPLEKFIRGARNLYSHYKLKAQKALGNKEHRVFIIMPIQGERSGTQDQQRIYKEYDNRFELLEKLLGKYGCVAIRIDKEYPLEELVARIKTEIEESAFVIADLTDERPSCYFEAGYAEASGRRVIYVASRESVITPRQKTMIHFDIHRNLHWFANHEELKSKVIATIDKNKTLLFPIKEIKSAALGS